MNRQQIDDLCMSAIESGYIPTENDIIFGHGLESIKFMVQRYTNFLDEVKLFDDSLINATPILEYEEICQLALNAGYEVNPRYIGKGLL